MVKHYNKQKSIQKIAILVFKILEIDIVNDKYKQMSIYKKQVTTCSPNKRTVLQTYGFLNSFFLAESELRMSSSVCKMRPF